MKSPLLSRLLWTRGLRAFAGYISLLLPLYLISLGMGPFEVGVIATATLLGSGILTLLVGLYASRFQYRSLLLMAAILMAVAAVEGTDVYVAGLYIIGHSNPICISF